MKQLILFLFPLFFLHPQITGTVIDAETNKPLSGVNITSGDIGTASDKDGRFTLDIQPETEMIFSHIGYETVTLTPNSPEIKIKMTPKAIKGKQVSVSATRAVAGLTPVAYSTLTPSEIEIHYTVEDVPMILASEPGVWAYSESGNGTGYSYVSIRGFDQSRIAVMLDNVPLNDNESHQVYWVDHGDILSDAKDVQIQRGIGNSLYGSAAFGGSINITTQIADDEPELRVVVGEGSFNTKKFSVKGNSGKWFGDHLGLSARYSQIESDGYREFHDSRQKAFSFGLEHRGKNMTNQFRTLIGYENTLLSWDGIYANDIMNRKKRREGYKVYTDDFLQHIYSLNTRWSISDGMTFSNTAYLVKGSGYYEVEKSAGHEYDPQDTTDSNQENHDDFMEFIQSYNLDSFYEESVSSDTLDLTLLRRKWIVNSYSGIVPVFTIQKSKFRLDIGAEFRTYFGDHFGEITNFSNPELSDSIGTDWVKYYQYFGKKTSITGFAHLVFNVGDNLKVIQDFQVQKHDWNLNQKKIGYAFGHNLSALWQFLNPRFGLVYSASDVLSVFINYGIAQKEPADNQIIEADDVWSTPVMAAAEVVSNLETGWSMDLGNMLINLNAYRILYSNEQLKNIDVEQEGEYDYYTADSTVHQGFEYELDFHLSSNLQFQMNGMFNDHHFSSGVNKGKMLTNIPNALVNLGLNWQVYQDANISANWKYVGTQYIDNENYGTIDPYSIFDVYFNYRWQNLQTTLKVNNVFDMLYSTHGYGYEWDGYHAYYWPGATRNIFLTISYHM